MDEKRKPLILTGYNNAGLAGIFSDAAAATEVAVVADHMLAAWERLIKAGIQPITIVDIPAGFAGNTSRVKFHQGIRQWVRDNASKHGSWWIDVADIAADPTSSVGNPLAALYAVESPLVHPGPRLALLVAQRLLALFAAKGCISTVESGQSRQDVYDALVNPRGNLLGNGGMMTFTTGGNKNGSNPPTGDVPDGYNSRNNNGGTGTIVNSIIARADGGNDWQTVITATTDIDYWGYVDMSNVTVGDIVSGSLGFNVVSSSGLDRVNLYLDEMNSGLTANAQRSGGLLGGAASSFGLMPTSTPDAKFPTPRMQISASGAKLRVLWSAYVTAGGNATIRISPSEVRKG